MRTVSAADANRHFSRLLHEVQAGAIVTVTSRGTPVATILPARSLEIDQGQAKQVLLARLEGQLPAGTTWRRSDLYDDDAPT